MSVHSAGYSLILNHKVYQVNIFLLTFPDSSILSTSLLEAETLFRVLLNASCFLSALTTAACLEACPYPKNIISAESLKRTDTGGKFPHGEGALTPDQILNAECSCNIRSSYVHPAHVSRRSGPLVLLRSALVQMISAPPRPVTA